MIWRPPRSTRVRSSAASDVYKRQVKPGMRDTEVAAVAQHYSQCHGSENGIYLCASMPLGQPSKFANRHLQNRVIQNGDQIALLVEDNGPGGMYTELGRSCVVGAKVPQAMQD